MKVMDGEVKTMQLLEYHKNLVGLHEIIDDEEDSKLILILDYCTKG